MLMEGQEDNREQETRDFLPEGAAAGGRGEMSVSQAVAARYEILRELGSGGMGVVYQARDRETGAVVALKTLHPAVAGRAELFERFKAELLLARKITHKNVCRVYDLNRFGNVAVISMEFIEGESLRSLLKRVEALTVGRGLKILGQILAGLKEAHAQGVVHRDLKPENILIARDGTVKVMDFGIARSVEAEASRTVGLIGTPAYMSPEQAEGKPADARSDLYSLGLMMYEMFTGRQVFEGETPVALAMKQVQEAPPPPRRFEPYLPSFLEDAILRCLEKRPEKRFQSVEDLEASLTEKRVLQPVEPAGAPEAVALPPRLEQWQRSDYGLLALAVLGAAFFFSLFDRAYPYAAAEIRTSREVAEGKALEVVHKFEPSARVVGAWPSFWDRPPDPYIQEVLQKGLPEVSRMLRERAPGWYLRMGIPGRKEASAELNSDGKLTGLMLPERPEARSGPLVREEALKKALLYGKELLGVDVSKVQPTVRPWKDGLWVEWPLPDQANPQWRLVIAFGKEGLLEAHFQTIFKPTAEAIAREQSSKEALYRWAPVVGLGSVAVLFLPVLLMLFLFFGRRLYQRTSAHAVLLASLTTLALVFLPVQGPPEAEDLSRFARPAGFVISFLFAYVVVRVAEHYLTRGLPVQAASWLMLFKERGKARSAGLALLRGCLLGFLFLGLHTAMLSALASAGLGGANLFWWTFVGGGPSSFPLLVVCVGVLATVWDAWCLQAFPMALASRFSRRAVVWVAVPTCFWLVTGTSLVGATEFPLVPLFLFAGMQALFFSFLLYRYGFLTMVLAMYTVESWVLGWSVLAMFHRIEWWQSSLSLFPWFLLLLLGLTIYFRPQLIAAKERMAEAFE